MDPRRVLPLALLLSLAFYLLTLPKDGDLPPGKPPEIVFAEPRVLVPKNTIAEDSSQITTIRESLSRGVPLTLSLQDHPSQSFLFRSRRSLADNFGIRLGLADSLDLTPQVFEGLPLNPDSAGTIASLVLAGNSLAAVLRQVDGTTTYLRTNPTTGAWEAQVESPNDIQALCEADINTGTYKMSSDDPLADGEAFWEDAISAQIAPERAGLTGIDPATNQLDKYIDPIARATRYDASLKVAMLLLVLDKQATGSDSVSNLTSKASIHLATVSNVAAAYENQLGVRLLIQEMIMIPDAGNYIDIPADGDDAISDFRTWMQRNRLNSTYRWSVAMKFGSGLSGTTLGVAFVDAVRNNSAVGICRASARWDVLAHEMGHNLGSNHSSGGLMNSTTTNNHNRSFFTDVSPGETSAKDIYDYARSRLLGAAIMRHPEEIPFANRDNERTLLNTSVLISPLENDNAQVRNGQANALALDEVSMVTPFGAGTVEILGNDVRFNPSTDFQGTVWFSYSLRGNVGNNGEGWLHKGDVAIEVGSIPNNTLVTLAPGSSYSFLPSTGTSSLSQPNQAQVSQSRDDDGLLVLRVDSNASGLDSFRAGGRTYTLDYSAPSPQVNNDHFVYDFASNGLTFNPLLNDQGAGEAWVNPIKPTIGVGTLDHDASGDALFPTTFRLISATNRTPDKGMLTTRTLPFTVDGQRTNTLDSTLTFAATRGSSGSAFIDYVAEDAAGHQASGEVEIVLPFRVDTLLQEGDIARYLLPADGTIDSTWMLPEFDASSWASGNTGLGYDTRTDFLSSIETTLTNFQGTSTSIFVRLPFTANSSAQYTQLALKMKIDDGFVAYLNGEEVARSSNVIGTSPLPWNTETTQSTNDSQALTFAVFDLTENASLLREGQNVLAIHGINASLASSDFLLVPELEASVTESGLNLVSPTSNEIQLPIDTNLILRTQATGAVAGDITTWRVLTGNSETVQITPSTATLSTALITSPGNYILEASTTTDGLSETIQIAITAIAEATNDSAAAVDAGSPISLTNYVTRTTASSPGPDFERAQWTQLTGPSPAIFSSPNSLDTTVAFPKTGSYTLRAMITRKGVETFDDVTVNVAPSPDALSALTTPAISVAPTSALLKMVTLFSKGPVEATLYLGTTDAQTNQSKWLRTIPIGTVLSGSFEIEPSNLLFETEYVYRLRLQRNESIVWSEPGRFTTAESTLIPTTLIDADSPARFIVPLDNVFGQTWSIQGFNDSTWTPGSAGVGFDLDTEFDPWIITDVQAEMYEQATSVYTRIPFQLSETATIESLALQMRYDDAFVAYLNGVEIVRSATAPQNVTLTSFTSAAILREDSEAVEPEAYDLSEHIGLLQHGENVLAIHGLNFIPENRDLLISPQLSIERRKTYYQFWLEDFPLSEGDQSILADPDGDGVDNLQEYAFGTDPTTAEQDRPGLTALSSDLSFIYNRRLDAIARGISFTLEQSLDLSHWKAVNDLSEEVGSSSKAETVRLDLPPITNESLGFWRLRVSLQ